MSLSNIRAAVEAAWASRTGRKKSDVDLTDSSISDGYEFMSRNAADTGDVPLIGNDEDDQILLGGEARNPIRQPITFHIYPNASMATQRFFINPTPRQLAITLAMEVHTTAGSDTTPPTVTVTHETKTSGNILQTAGGGTAVLSSALSVHATAATVQTGTLAGKFNRTTRNTITGSGVVVLQPGESLSAKFAGTLTALVGVTITVYVMPGAKYHFVNFYANAAGTPVTTSLMISMVPRKLLYGAVICSAPEASAGTLTLDVTKDASATAAGGGTSMLASTVNMKTIVANTYTQLSLSATVANLATAATDSVAVKLSASATELAGVCVTLAFSTSQDHIQVDYNQFNSTIGTNEEFWIADRLYQVSDIGAKWATASTSRIVGVTRDTGTNTPASGGVVVQTDNTNAGFDTSATAATPVFATLAATRNLIYAQGDRAGLKNDSGTLGSLAGLQVSMRLRAL